MSVQDGWLVQRDGDDEMTWEATLGDAISCALQLAEDYDDEETWGTAEIVHIVPAQRIDMRPVAAMASDRVVEVLSEGIYASVAIVDPGMAARIEAELRRAFVADIERICPWYEPLGRDSIRVYIDRAGDDYVVTGWKATTPALHEQMQEAMR